MHQYKTRTLPGSDHNSLREAFKLIKNGSLVAFPTDTVYGLGADVFNANSIGELYTVKGREGTKAIAVLLGNLSDLQQITAEMNYIAQRLAEKFWPGALTLVVSSHPNLPENISPLPTVGVRMPNHPIALDLLKQTGPLATTSANLSGHASPKTAQEVFIQLKGRIPLILDGGRTPGGTPSTVVDCTVSEPVILREGPISLEQIMAVIA
jgi:L-threonylcarbamoyladenylate synthase